MRYRSKKDIGLVAPLWAGLLIPFLLGISFLIRPGILQGIGWLLLFIGIVTGAVILALTYPMYYEITPATLLVRSGVLHVEIPLNDIQQVFPDRTLGSAPAWSLDRLRVDYRKKGLASFVHISPEDKLKFMQDLAEHAEDLEVRDGRVVRRH